MNVCIRADASARIGTGHVYRCLTLADELRRRGASVTFLCRELEGHLIGYIRERGYRAKAMRPLSAATARAAAHGEPAEAGGRDGLRGGLPLPTVPTVPTLPQGGEPPEGSWLADADETARLLREEDGEPPDWLIVDHYGLDWRYESRVRAHVGRLMVIDDLANRSHRCELLLDQNYYADPHARYADWIGAGCRQLLGPRYALLRPEFAGLRERLRRDGASVRRVLVSFGGADRSGATLTALRALTPLAEEGIELTVVAGRLNPDAERIRTAYADRPGIRVLPHAEHLAQLMTEADLAVGAGGTTTWERCCLGLPSIIVTIADNQLELTKHAAAAGAVLYLGSADEVDAPRIREAAERLRSDAEARARMSRSALALTDGRGAERVAEELWRSV